MRTLVPGICLMAVACTAGAADHRVLIKDMAFSPSVVSVKPGDTITWVNQDIFVHNVSAAAAGVESGELKPGQSWRYKVGKGGDFDYLCTLHPTMKGRVEVRDALTPARRRSTS